MIKVGKPVFIILCTILVCLSVYLLSFKRDSAVAFVDGEPVTADELRMFMNNLKTEVSTSYQEKYGVSQIDDHFWKKDFSGSSPIQTLRNKALDEAVTVKVKQMIGKKLGLVQDISYKAILNNLNAENKRRAEAVSKNEIIFGPEKFSIDTYFTYYMSNMEADSIQQLMLNEMKPTGQEMRDYYDANKEMLFKHPDYIKIKKYAISFVDANNQTDENKKKKAAQKAEEILAAVKNEQDLTGNEDVKIEEQVFEPQNNLLDSRLFTTILYEAQKLSMGQVSPIFEYQGTYDIIKCLERNDSGYLSFDEVEKNNPLALLKPIAKTKYDQYVESLRKAAKVEKAERKFNRVELG